MKLKLGGQAVIEGVMVKSLKNLAIVVRKPNGKIKVKKEKIKSLLRYRFFKLPFIRGFINLIEILIIGIKALNYSSSEATGEDEDMGFFAMALMFLLAFALAIFIFKFIPLAITQFFSKVLNFSQNRYIFNILEGILKVLFFVGYIYIISFAKDVKRVFQYHGAEHMSIACFEAGKKLTTENIRKFSKEHVRCGTSFIVLVILISIIVYSFLPIDISLLWKFMWRILLLPVIAGISYEVLKISHKFEKKFLLNIFIKPGLWIQKMTTKKPDNRQIEIAKKAVEAVIAMEKS